MSLVLNIVIAILLSCTIVYCSILYRRLVELRRDKAHLDELAVKFGEATARAEESVINLRKSSATVTERLENGISTAEGIRDDLKYLIERGGELADRLEGHVRAAERGGRSDRPLIADAAGEAAQPDRRSETEAARQIIKALQAAR